MEKRIFTLGAIRRLDQQITKGEISISRYIEILNEMAYRKWVSVKEKLPNHSDEVLIFTVKQKLIKKGFFVLEDQWKRQNMFIAEMGYFSVSDITHWMPLPSPPKD